MTRLAARNSDGTYPTVTLVGIREISLRLGVSSQAVSNWINRYPGFPEPVARLKMGPVFIWEFVIKWHESRVKPRGDNHGESD